MLTWLGKVFRTRYRVVLEHDGFWSAERWYFIMGWMYVSQTIGNTRVETVARLALVRGGKYKEIHDVE